MFKLLLILNIKKKKKNWSGGPIRSPSFQPRDPYLRKIRDDLHVEIKNTIDDILMLTSI